MTEASKKVQTKIELISKNGMSYQVHKKENKAQEKSEPSLSSSTKAFPFRASSSFIAYPEGTSLSPALLVMPEFWGLNDYTKNRAIQLAQLGYIALAVDIYGGGFEADTASQATEWMNNVAFTERGNDILLAHIAYLKDWDRVDRNKMGLLGYCMGGALALRLSRLGLADDFRALVSFHGKLEPILKNERVLLGKALYPKMLICHGEEDQMIPKEHVISFKQEMEEAGVDYQLFSYQGAGHGFTNPLATERGKKYGVPLAYNEEADKKSWNQMKEFLSKTFGS